MLPFMSVPQEPRFSRFSLARVLDDLGATLLEVMFGRVDETQNVGGVAIYDPVDEPVYPERAIVLGVGVRDARDLEAMLRDLGPHEPSAVIVRSSVSADAAVLRLAEEYGIVLFGLARGATWTQLAALLRSLLAEDDIGEAHIDSLGGIPSGDLFAVANAIASLVDAPVTIEDRSSRVLAFSGRQEEADTARAETIVGRRVPERVRQILAERGVFRDLYRSPEPVVIGPITFSDVITTQRVAIGVRAGDEVLGSVWAAMDGPLSEERVTTLRDAAKLVALHLLRVRAGADVQRRLRAELLSTALEGGTGASEALSRLNLSGQPICVVAAAPYGPPASSEDATEEALMAERERFADAFAVHLSAMRPGSSAALLGDTIFGILPAHNDPQGDRAVRMMNDFLDRVGTRTSAVIAVGPPAEDLPGIAKSRATVMRILRVLHTQLRDSGRSEDRHRVARLPEVYADVLTLELRDLMVARGDDISGPIAVLLEHDLKHRGHLVDTLRSWFDHFGDVSQAAAALFVHPNTFRYRLRRVTEVSGLRLGDPDERFAAMLQLRLLDSSRG